MKKTLLICLLISAAALLGGCGSCSGSYANNACCGADSYTGTWY